MQLDRTRAIISQLSSKGKAPITLKDSKAVMVILTGTSTDIDEWIKPLIRARGCGIRYELVLSKAANEMLDTNRLTLKLQPRRVIVEGNSVEESFSLDNIDAIVAPLLSQNTAFKLLNGIQDQLIPRLLWQGLWVGKSIWLNLEGLRTYRGLEASSKPLLRLVEDNIQRLISMGIKELNNEKYMVEVMESLGAELETNILITPSNSMEVSISSSNMGLRQGLSLGANTSGQSNKKSIVTERDILRTPPEIKEIKLPIDSIVTPLAYDTAKRRGIKIIKA